MIKLYKRHIIGKEGEDKACEYLKSIGYNLINRNFSCRQGEIDIIASMENEYVFIEVKTRTNKIYGRPAEAVDWRKKSHIIDSAKYYLYINNIVNCNIRFDVIEIYLKNSKYYINHLRDVI